MKRLLWVIPPLKFYLSTNIIANVRHAWLYECAVHAMRKKLSSDGGDSRNEMWKRLWWRLWCGLMECAFGGRREYGVRRSILCCAFGGNLASVAVKMFSHLIHFIKKFYKCCTFNMIWKDATEINCITVQHKKGSFPSTLTGHTTLFFITIIHMKITYTQLTIAAEFNILAKQGRGLVLGWSPIQEVIPNV
jgi:hypothetical protein